MWKVMFCFNVYKL